MRIKIAFLLCYFMLSPSGAYSQDVKEPTGPGQAEKNRQMTNTEKLAVAREMLNAWNRLDWEAVYELFGEDGTLHSMMVEPVTGNAAIRKHLGKYESGLTRMDFIILRMGIVNGEVVVERQDSFDFNGHSGTVPVVGVMKIEDGRVQEWREYYDLSWLRIAMGVLAGTPPHALSPVEPHVGTDNMSGQEKLSVARAMLDAYEALDWEKVVSLIAEDGVVHYVEKEAMVGKQAVREHVERVGPFVTRVDFKIRNMGLIDGVVAIERIDDFEYKGRHVAIPVYGIMEIADGKIKVWREYYDHTQMRQGMGIE